MLLERPPLEAMIASVLARRGLSADAAVAAARDVLEAVTSEPVRSTLTDVVHAHYVSATAAAIERDDLYLPMNDSGVIAHVVVDAVIAYLRPEGRPTSDPAGKLAAQLASIDYKGWQFDLVKLPPDERLGVRVTATVTDSRIADGEDARVLRVSRVAPIRAKGVYAAAFSAVMAIEEHEARERFRAGGKRVVDPHDAADVPAPTNRRPDTAE